MVIGKEDSYFTKHYDDGPQPPAQEVTKAINAVDAEGLAKTVKHIRTLTYVSVLSEHIIKIIVKILFIVTAIHFIHKWW